MYFAAHVEAPLYKGKKKVKRKKNENREKAAIINVHVAILL